MGKKHFYLVGLAVEGMGVEALLAGCPGTAGGAFRAWNTSRLIVPGGAAVRLG